MGQIVPVMTDFDTVSPTDFCCWAIFYFGILYHLVVQNWYSNTSNLFYLLYRSSTFKLGASVAEWLSSSPCKLLPVLYMAIFFKPWSLHGPRRFHFRQQCFLSWGELSVTSEGQWLCFLNIFFLGLTKLAKCKFFKFWSCAGPDLFPWN